MFKPLAKLKKTVKNFFTPKTDKKIDATHSTEHVGRPKMPQRSRDEWNAYYYNKRLARFSNTSYRKAPAIDKTFRHKQPKEVNHGHHPVIGLTLAPR